MTCSTAGWAVEEGEGEVMVMPEAVIESVRELSATDGVNTIAYRQQSATSAQLPTVVFIHGFRSDMGGGKAEYLANFCKTAGLGFLRFDLRGHGQSGGVYTDFTISDWLADTLNVLDNLTTGPLLLVGSSLGGWLMLRAAQERPARIKALVGIAPAPDFVSDFIEPAMTTAQKAEVEQTGYLTVPSGFPEPNRFSKKLLADGKAQRVLHQSIAFNGPVRILQGTLDTDVPWQHALKIQNMLTSDDVEVKLFKDGDHRLSSAAQLEELGRTVGVLATRV